MLLRILHLGNEITIDIIDLFSKFIPRSFLDCGTLCKHCRVVLVQADWLNNAA